MTCEELIARYSAILEDAGLPTSALEVRHEVGATHSLFYAGDLIGLYKDTYRLLRLKNGVVVHDDTDPRHVIAQALVGVVKK